MKDKSKKLLHILKTTVFPILYGAQIH